MHQLEVTYVLFLIFTGTAILSTLALYTRQSLLVAYIVLGALFGPSGFKFVNDPEIVRQAGDIGIIFLLFLLGLDLQPQSLFHSLRKMSAITLTSSCLFFLIGFVICYYFGYSFAECMIAGAIAMFSSTIIGIKLLPTTILHHQHTGELAISILLLQDMIAIGVIFILEVMANRTGVTYQLVSVISAIPILLLVAYIFQKYILTHLLTRFDKIHEYIFILSLGWCLCLAEIGHALGVSEEIGAFIAGVSLASNPVAAYIADSLKTLRDFFLIIFFFAIGASFNLSYLPQVIIPAATLALAFLTLKPIVFRWLLRQAGEVRSVSHEIGVRLGQMSEFSLLVVFMSTDIELLSPISSHMLEAAIILTLMVSCYWIVMYYPTPLAASDKLRRD